MSLVQLWHAPAAGSAMEPQRTPRPGMTHVAVGMSALVVELCELPTDERRQDALRDLVEGWAGENNGVVEGWLERRRWADSFAAALATEGAAVQAAAFAARERGEDTAEGERRVWAIVDMSVQLVFCLRSLKTAEESRLIFSEDDEAAEA